MPDGELIRRDPIYLADFHTHILPRMDDGSKSVSESLRMLELMTGQGTELAAATPHYRWERESIPQFLTRRTERYAELMERAAGLPALPELLLGAEVAFFHGIGTQEDLEALCIGCTRLLLLEMPQEPWSSRTLQEVYGLLVSRGITPVIAHIERCFGRQPVERLLDMGIPVQTDGGALGDRREGRTLLRYLLRGRPVLLGSDCHNLTDRPPGLDAACGMIRRKLGERKLEEMNGAAMRLLGRPLRAGDAPWAPPEL